MNDFEQLLLDEIRGLKTDLKEVRSEIRDVNDEVVLIKLQLAGYKARMTMLGGFVSIVCSGVVAYFTHRS